MAAAVAAAIARPADCAPNAGTSSANRPSAMPAARVRNRGSRQSCEPGSGFADDAATGTADAAIVSPSGSNPICCGVFDKARSASSQTVTAVTTPIAGAATGKLRSAIAATHSGENTMPPTLAPLYAMDSAAGRVRMNQGETIWLTAAAPMAAQPAPLRTVAARSCQGSCATAQAVAQEPSASAPALVTPDTPKWRYSFGRLATTIAPIRKWAVTAVDTSANDHPRSSRTACR